MVHRQTLNPISLYVKWICLLTLVPQGLNIQRCLELFHLASSTFILSKNCGVQLHKFAMFALGLWNSSWVMRSCCGSVDKTTDSQIWDYWFKSAGSSRSALGQGTLSSLSSKALYPNCLVSLTHARHHCYIENSIWKPLRAHTLQFTKFNRLVLYQHIQIPFETK